MPHMPLKAPEGPIEIRPVDMHSRRQLRRYVKYGIDLYADSPCHVPPLVFDDVNTLSPGHNPAYEHCTAQSFMAYGSDGKPLGRITAIINPVVNQRTGRHDARFGFVDFIDDHRVVDALFQAAADWAKAQGMDALVGPMGFTDMDHEGMLIEGFDQMGTMATIYNHPYYPEHMQRMGFVKETDWVEYRITVPEEIPEKFGRIAAIVKAKYGLRSIKFTSRKVIKEKYGRELFRLINEAYDDLYGYSPLTDRQIEYYIDQYLGMIRLDCISVIVDANDRLVAVGITMPSLSQALRRSRGRLFPTGWIHLLRGIKGKNPVVDLLLVAVRREYMGKGVNALLFTDLIPIFNRQGFHEAESNVELEGNDSVRLQWQYFPHRQHRRRRAWRKPI